MKKTLLALMMLSAAAAYAGEAEDRLLSVQSVYRAALHEQKQQRQQNHFPAKRFGKRAAPFAGRAIRY